MTNPIPDGMTGLIPHLVCDPCDQAIEFYTRAFGAEELSRSVHPETGKILHAAMRLGSQVLFMSDDFPEFCADGKPSSPQALGGTPVTVHRYVADCDNALATAQSAGATLVMPAEDMFWGDRYGIVVDPFGHRWSLATHIRDVTEDEMKAAMSDLSMA
ncbi:MAG: VOC family protein [Pseudomonadales bacterium]|nr:VOC family protein [Pseudomonadales bacterium]